MVRCIILASVPDNDDPQRFVASDQACEILGVSVRTFRRLVRERQIVPAVVLAQRGNPQLFRLADVADLRARLVADAERRRVLRGAAGGLGGVSTRRPSEPEEVPGA